jgi:hypothetical protein
MKKTSLLSFLLFFSYFAHTQVISGGSLDAERKLLDATASFTIESASTKGHLIVECAVNRDGKVTGTRTLSDKSTVKSTPALMKAENLAKKLTFTPGTKYAPFEHVLVKYTFVITPKTATTPN